MPPPRHEFVKSSAIFWIFKIETGAGIPFAALVAVGWHAAGLFEHLRQVHKIPSHKGGIAIGEVITQANLAAVAVVVAIAWAGAGFADPASVGLRRNGTAN